MKQKERSAMEIIRLYPECVKCLLSKQLDRCPKDAPLEKRVEYTQNILKIVANAPKHTSAPVLVRGMYDLQKDMFGIETDYKEIKSYFNQMMMRLETKLWDEIWQDEDPLRRAIQYAMIGNYIDFAALKDVDENALLKFLDKASEETVNEKELVLLKEQIGKSQRLIYLLDNCGEIVTDKLLMRLIKKQNPQIHIVAMVRGGQVMNDATYEDAAEVSLEEIAEITDSGCNIAGTSLEEISDEAKCVIESADIIIAKGQGNFETLHQCGKNIFYIFMCKCEMFMKRFSLPRFTGVLVHEENIPKSGGL